MKQFRLIIILVILPLISFSQNGLVRYNSGVWSYQGGAVSYLSPIVASDYGFLPTSSASENTAAWNSFPVASLVSITIPGTYEIDGTLLLKSNTTYMWLNVLDIDTVRKIENLITPYTHMFANEGISTLTRNENIEFYGNGLFFDENGYELRAPAADYHMVGNINLFKVDGFKLDGFEQAGGGTQLFFGHFADVNNFTISNMNIENEKAAFQFQGNTFDGTLSDIYTDTYDDALALNAIDFPIVMADVGDISRITIDNWTDNDIVHSSIGGHSIRLMPGSWTNWANGNTYNINDACVNAGNIYIRYGTDTPQVGTDAPTHTTGTVVGSDGISWNFLQTSTDTTALITDITVSNSTMNTNGTIFHPETNNDANMKSIYPGTEGNGYIDNIVIDNISLLYRTPQASSNRLFSSAAFTKKVSLINSTINNDFVGYLFNTGIASTYTNYFDSLIIDNCDITFGNINSFVYYKLNTSEGEYFQVDNSTIDLNGQQITLYQQSLTERRGLIEIDNSTISDMSSISYPNNLYDLDVTASNSTFTNAARILYKNNSLGDSVDYVSTGCTYSDPTSSYLFQSLDSKMSVNTYSSTGTVTQSAIANDSVVKGDVDLYDSPVISSIIARVVSNDELAVYFDIGLDTNSIPDVSAFAVSGKTVSSISIDSNILVLLMTTDFLTTDTPVISYTTPSTNKLRGYPAGNVADFTNESVYVWELDHTKDTVWYDFADLSTVTTDGYGNVSKWANKSSLGTSGDLIPEGDTSVYPDSVATGLYFDGTNDFLIKRSFNINDTSSIYFVIVQDSYETNSRIMHNSQGIYYLQQSPSPNVLRIHNTTMQSNDLDIGVRDVIKSIGAGSSSFLQVGYYDKVTGTIASFAGTNGIRIGSDSSSNFTNMTLSEVIIRGGLDSDNYILSMTRYLKNKWSIE